MVHADPDTVRVTLSLSNSAEKATDAMQANSVQFAVLRERFAPFALPDSAIDVSVPRILSNFDKRKVSSYSSDAGFTAQRIVILHLSDLAQLAPLLDAIVQSKAATLNHIGYVRANHAADLTLARERAVAAARLKAETYAAAAGIMLGPVVSIAEEISTPTNNGTADTVNVSASITMTFALTP